MVMISISNITVPRLEQNRECAIIVKLSTICAGNRKQQMRNTQYHGKET